jgi:hypothetical protein
MKYKHRKEIEERFFEYKRNKGIAVINSWDHWRIGMILYWSARIIYNVSNYTERFRYCEELSTQFYKNGAISYEINVNFPGCLNNLRFTFTKTPDGLERIYYYDTNTYL